MENLELLENQILLADAYQDMCSEKLMVQLREIMYQKIIVFHLPIVDAILIIKEEVVVENE